MAEVEANVLRIFSNVVTLLILAEDLKERLKDINQGSRN